MILLKSFYRPELLSKDKQGNNTTMWSEMKANYTQGHLFRKEYIKKGKQSD